MIFIKFLENNDMEGETWAFWLQYDGNEKAIQVLQEKLLETYADMDYPCFELEMDTKLTEAQVDKKVAKSKSGYLAFHNKVTGIISDENLQKIIDAKYIDGEQDDLTELLYKGAIKELFT